MGIAPSGEEVIWVGASRIRITSIRGEEREQLAVGGREQGLFYFADPTFTEDGRFWAVGGTSFKDPSANGIRIADRHMGEPRFFATAVETSAGPMMIEFLHFVNPGELIGSGTGGVDCECVIA